MTELLASEHLLGLAIGVSTFLVIGLFHPVVIKCEYHFGVRCWWWFLVLGIIFGFLAYTIEDIFWSSVSGVVAFSSFWTIKEIFDQKRRVEKGWFPANPKRVHTYRMRRAELD